MENEITVKLKCSIKEISEILENKNFTIIKKFILNDTYFIPKELELNTMSYRDILGKTIILRNIVEEMPKNQIIKLTKKIKNIDEKGNILNQNKIDCQILNIESGKEFLNAIGYIELMNIKESDVVYSNRQIEIAVKDIKNGDNLIEVETKDNGKIDTIDKIKQKINELQLPIDTNDYFVKKAEIELKKFL